jgi:hypothetical protein
MYYLFRHTSHQRNRICYQAYCDVTNKVSLWDRVPLRCVNNIDYDGKTYNFERSQKIYELVACYTTTPELLDQYPELLL